MVFIAEIKGTISAGFIIGYWIINKEIADPGQWESISV